MAKKITATAREQLVTDVYGMANSVKVAFGERGYFKNNKKVTEYGFLDFMGEKTPLIKVACDGGRIKTGSAMLPIGAMLLPRYVRDSFAGSKDTGWSTGEVRLRVSEALKHLWHFVADHATEVDVYAASYWCSNKSTQCMDVYVLDKVDAGISIYLTICDKDLVNVSERSAMRKMLFSK